MTAYRDRLHAGEYEDKPRPVRVDVVIDGKQVAKNATPKQTKRKAKPSK